MEYDIYFFINIFVFSLLHFNYMELPNMTSDFDKMIALAVVWFSAFQMSQPQKCEKEHTFLFHTRLNYSFNRSFQLLKPILTCDDLPIYRHS